jgi:hypothetical protein
VDATKFGNDPTAFTDADTTITDLFWWDKATGTQKLITHSSVAGNNASAATAASAFSGISADSSAVVFSNVDATKFGNNGVAFTDTGTALTDLFWWDKATGEQKLISHNSAAGNTASSLTLNSIFRGISADSSAVVFANADATNFGNNGTAFTDADIASDDIFWWDKATGVQKLVTHSSTAGNTESAATNNTFFTAFPPTAQQWCSVVGMPLNLVTTEWPSRMRGLWRTTFSGGIKPRVSRS